MQGILLISTKAIKSLGADKEGTLDAEVVTLKKKIDDMTSDIWSKEFIDGMSADQLAPLKAELAKLEASLPDVEARGERTGTMSRVV